MIKCESCFAQIDEEVVYCPYCGEKIKTVRSYRTEDAKDASFKEEKVFTGSVESGPTTNKPKSFEWTGIRIAAAIFCVIGIIGNISDTVFLGSLSFLSLLWTIPMTIYYVKSIKSGRKMKKGFKVCALLFVSLIAGILMLCDKETNIQE